MSDDHESEADEAYKIGVCDGYQDAVQNIDTKTGGDGEYRWSTDPDRHTPDADTMVKRIVERFATLLSALSAAEARAEAAEAMLLVFMAAPPDFTVGEARAAIAALRPAPMDAATQDEADEEEARLVEELISKGHSVLGAMAYARARRACTVITFDGLPDDDERPTALSEEERARVEDIRQELEASFSNFARAGHSAFLLSLIDKLTEVR